MASSLHPLRAPGRLVASLLPILALASCHAGNLNQREARAADEWVRSYSLPAGGEISIFNRNGAIDVEEGGNTVDVRAERVVRATSEKTANNVLATLEITEDIKPERVAIRTAGVDGILVGVSFEVTYHVRVPKGLVVRLQTSNGNIVLTGVGGRIVANTANGTIKGTRLGGGVETRTTNGNIEIELTKVGTDPIAIRTTNGSVTLTIPVKAAANLTASASNGSIAMTGVNFEATGEQGPERGRSRRVRGRLNAGGTSIELQTVNGNIAIAAPSPAEAQD